MSLGTPQGIRTSENLPSARNNDNPVPIFAFIGPPTSPDLSRGLHDLAETARFLGLFLRLLLWQRRRLARMHGVF
jgi:hypothetical protein